MDEFEYQDLPREPEAPAEENAPVPVEEPAPVVIPESQPVPEEVPQKKKRKKHPGAGTFFGKLFRGLLIGALVVGAVNVTSLYWNHRTALQLQSMSQQIQVLRAELAAAQERSDGNSVSGTPNVNPSGQLTPAQVYAMNQKSVVLIQTDVATGSGFVLSEDGYVVTNYHVVADGKEINVVLWNSAVHKATLVGQDENNDIALLKMSGSGFQAVTLGSSDALIVGDQVAAIGNPLGELTSTLTVGYVSAKERDVSTESATISMLQTDCAINSGNSGGPLFNMKGEVVGITSAKYSGMSSSGASIPTGTKVRVDRIEGVKVFVSPAEVSAIP